MRLYKLGGGLTGAAGTGQSPIQVLETGTVKAVNIVMQALGVVTDYVICEVAVQPVSGLDTTNSLPTTIAQAGLACKGAAVGELINHFQQCNFPIVKGATLQLNFGGIVNGTINQCEVLVWVA